MKTITRIFGMLAVTSAAIFINACKAEKGEIGPIGPTGATGVTGVGTAGATGATGAKGDKGDTGTANVLYSDWITVNFSGSGTVYTGIITAPKITQDVLDKGTVLIYLKSGNLFYSINYAEIVGGVTYTIVQILTVGKITLKGSYNPSSSQFRYVIIPGGTGIGGGRNASLKSLTYEEIKALYNLPN